MKTTNLDLTEEWQLVADTDQTYDVQVEFGSALFCLSQTTPDASQAGQTVRTGRWLKFTDLKVWFKTTLAGSYISVSSYATPKS
ncbi:hypothetical protein [Pantoea agglomerans]|uniref:hypothetical protein n=1 Tax=Enterobacter agglomerans TaxID=549 RepID=UPI001F1C013E|nr:hypothetical protein [Pantoea agglomerans]UJL38425.1 hypothetical protein JK642_06660 [Pantoea agglomerans]